MNPSCCQNRLGSIGGPVNTSAELTERYMFTAKLSIPKHDADFNFAVETGYDLLCCWYKNGQIVGSSWVTADAGTTLDAYVCLPRLDSLESQHNNSYGAQLLETLRPGTCSVTILGRDPNLPSCCTCNSRSGLVLFTHYLSDLPPVRCLDCFDPVPLYELPHIHDDEHLGLLQWAADYRACDTLQMHTTTGERFGERQLLEHDSSLSQNGRDLCLKIEALMGIPCYYYLHKTRSRGRKSELERNCPSCGSAWRLSKRLHLFDFQCNACRLLSAVAAIAS
jgi:predicted  nucleic acid-binding Zn ribbon protein